MKVKEFCLRSFFFSFVAPIMTSTIIIGLACRWLNVNSNFGYGALIVFAVALLNIQTRLIDRRYESVCRDCGKKPGSAVFWQKKNCPCGGEIVAQSKQGGKR